MVLANFLGYSTIFLAICLCIMSPDLDGNRAPKFKHGMFHGMFTLALREHEGIHLLI